MFSPFPPEISKRWLLPALILLCLGGCSSPEADLKRGNSAFREAEYGKAEEFYREALKEPSTRERASFNLGRTLFAESRYQEAQGYFEQAMGLEAEHPEVRIYHAKTLILQGKTEQAAADLARSLKAHPELKEANLLLDAQIRLSENDFPEAAEKFKSLLRSYPDNLEGLLGLARAFEGLGEQDKALQVYRAIIQRTPFGRAEAEEAREGVDRLS